MRRLLLRVARLVPRPMVNAVNSWRWSGGPVRRRLAEAAASYVGGGGGVVGRGPAAGLRFDAGGTHPGFVLGTSEPEVQELAVELIHRGDVFYDVGALAGFFSLLGARLVGPEGAVYAFEPVPEHAQLIRDNAAQNGLDNVHVVEAAAWSSGGESEFLVATHQQMPGRSRLLEATAGGEEVEEQVFGRRIPVSRVALDELIDDGTLRPPSVVKLDVEGAEIEALRGMSRALARYRPALIVELHWTGPEFVEFVRAELPGYEVRRIDGDGPIDRPVMMHVVALPG